MVVFFILLSLYINTSLSIASIFFPSDIICIFSDSEKSSITKQRLLFNQNFILQNFANKFNNRLVIEGKEQNKKSNSPYKLLKQVYEDKEHGIYSTVQNQIWDIFLELLPHPCEGNILNCLQRSRQTPATDHQIKAFLLELSHKSNVLDQYISLINKITYEEAQDLWEAVIDCRVLNLNFMKSLFNVRILDFVFPKFPNDPFTPYHSFPQFDCRCFHKIEKLYLSNTQTTELIGLEELKNLTHLYVYENLLGHCYLKENKNLKVLDLSSNELTEINLWDLHLEEIYLENNLLKTIEGLNISSLEICRLENNPLECINKKPYNTFTSSHSKQPKNNKKCNIT